MLSSQQVPAREAELDFANNKILQRKSDRMISLGRCGFVLYVTILLLLIDSTSVHAVNSKSAFVQNVIYSNRIVIFSKSYCPYSLRAKRVFSELHEKPFVMELDIHDNGREIQDILLDLVGQGTVPQVFVNGKHIGGSDDTVKALHNGELQNLLSKRRR